MVTYTNPALVTDTRQTDQPAYGRTASDISIWECSDELAYLDDNGAETTEDDGMPYHPDDYYPPTRFTRGPEPAANTDR